MLSASKISISDMPEIVLASFKNDRALIEKYHVVNTTLSDCVKDTVERIKEAASVYELKYYVVKYGENKIGFFVTGENFLYSFALNIKYRTKEIASKFWDLIVSKLPENFFSVMNLKNERAIKFLERNKMKIINTTEGETTLIYTPCQ